MWNGDRKCGQEYSILSFNGFLLVSVPAINLSILLKERMFIGMVYNEPPSHTTTHKTAHVVLSVKKLISPKCDFCETILVFGQLFIFYETILVFRHVVTVLF